MGTNRTGLREEEQGAQSLYEVMEFYFTTTRWHCGIQIPRLGCRHHFSFHKVHNTFWHCVGIIRLTCHRQQPTIGGSRDERLQCHCANIHLRVIYRFGK